MVVRLFPNRGVVEFYSVGAGRAPGSGGDVGPGDRGQAGALRVVVGGFSPVRVSRCAIVIPAKLACGGTDPASLASNARSAVASRPESAITGGSLAGRKCAVAARPLRLRQSVQVSSRSDCCVGVYPSAPGSFRDSTVATKPSAVRHWSAHAIASSPGVPSISARQLWNASQTLVPLDGLGRVLLRPA